MNSTKITRLYDFVAGTKAQSGQVDGEFDNIIAAYNKAVDDLNSLQSLINTIQTNMVNKAYVDTAILNAEVALMPTDSITDDYLSTAAGNVRFRLYYLTQDVVTLTDNFNAHTADTVSHAGSKIYAYKNLGGSL